jgi:hypothetical protein
MNISSARLARGSISTKSKRLASIKNASAWWSTCVPATSRNRIVASGIGATPTTSNPWNHARSFSTFQAPPDLRTFPQYTVFGETTMFSLKLNMPTFIVRNNILGVEANKRGRVLLEWIPRDADGKFQEKSTHQAFLRSDFFLNFLHL